jgi:hypothetical protein
LAGHAYDLTAPSPSSFCGGNLLDLGLALEVLTLDKVGDLVVVLTLLLLEVLVALSELAERSKGVGAELVKDAGDKLSELLVLTVAVDGEGVGGDGGVDLGGSKVDDVSVLLEHVDLLNSLDGLGVQLLKGELKLLVVGTGAGRCALDLSSGGTLSTSSGTEAELLEAFLDVGHDGRNSIAGDRGTRSKQ